jgi:plastocyanin
VRLRRRHLPLPALLAIAAGVLLPTIADSATSASITAVDNGVYEHSWQANGLAPAEVAVTPGSGVSFAYPTGVNYHYPIFKTGPATPSCEGLPHTLSEAGPGWSGSCTFTAEGTYEFWCGVHGAAMKAFVHVTASGTLPPTASTSAASPVSETEATLRGTVNPNGQPTSYHFNYGASSSYGQETTELFAGEDSVAHPVSAALTGLSVGVTYHFQLVATYESGASTVLGADRTFIAASPLPPLPETTTTTTTTTTASPPPPTTSTATTTFTTSTPPPSSAASLGVIGGSPLAGSASTAIKVSGAQHGSSIHGSLDISPAGAGGRLEVDLLAASASLARKHTKQVRIGRLLRASLAAGRLSFAVSLNAPAKRALHRHRRLPVIVQITLSPLHGPALTMTRSVTLRG